MARMASKNFCARLDKSDLDSTGTSNAGVRVVVQEPGILIASNGLLPKTVVQLREVHLHQGFELRWQRNFWQSFGHSGDLTPSWSGPTPIG